MVKPVAIYADQGASELGVCSLEEACRNILGYPCKRVFSNDILHSDLRQYELLVMPGGADLPYCERLNGVGNRKIRDFISQGGHYLGICAGAYYGCSALDFTGVHYKVSGSRELGLFDGIAQGSLPELTNGYYFDESSRAKALIPIQLNNGQSTSVTCYYHGGCAFIENPYSQRSSRVLGYYPNGKAAIVAGQFGQGSFVLSGVHFELDADCYAAAILHKNNIQDAKEWWIYQQLQKRNTDEISNIVVRALSL